MFIIKMFFVQTAQARVLYLSCLTCVIVLVVFFSYNLFPHLHLRAVHIAYSRLKTASDFQAPFAPEGLGGPDADNLFLGRPGEILKPTLTPNEKGQPTYAILMPTYVRHINSRIWYALVH